MNILIFSALIILAAIIIRSIPHYFAPHGVGVDHWYWKAYIEEYRRNGKFPPKLPQFILDEHQWYPPLFPLLIARLPEDFFDRYSYLIAKGIDILRMLLVMTSAFFITGQAASMLAAGIVYALTPILVSYNVQLNPRGLGALFLDIIIMLVIAFTWHSAPWWVWILVAFFSGLILLTHKMTAQLFWFFCITTAVLAGDWRFLLLVPVSIVTALILSRGFYLNTLRAHWDIVTFWNRNWPWISAHPVLESPIYGVPGHETPSKYFLAGFRGFWRRMLYLIGFNPWAWALLLVAYYMYSSGSHVTSEGSWIISWLAAILSFVLLTTFIPVMRCLGNGYLYLYNSSFPAALVAGIILGGFKNDPIVNIVLGGTLMLCIFSVAFYVRTLKKSKTLKIDHFMNDALERLRFLPNGVVMCFPQHWHDVASYKSGKPVLYGAHGYGFKRIEPIFPRVTKPISEVITEYNVKYLLTYDGYLPANFLKDLPPAGVEKFGQYRLFSFSAKEDN